MEKAGKGNLTTGIETLSGEGFRRRSMAIPKPIRLLGAGCMLLFLFLMLRIVQSPSTISLPGGATKGEYDSFVRDPNLDGKKTAACDVELC